MVKVLKSWYHVGNVCCNDYFFSSFLHTTKLWFGWIRQKKKSHQFPIQTNTRATCFGTQTHLTLFSIKPRKRTKIERRIDRHDYHNPKNSGFSVLCSNKLERKVQIDFQSSTGIGISLNEYFSVILLHFQNCFSTILSSSHDSGLIPFYFLFWGIIFSCFSWTNNSGKTMKSNRTLKQKVSSDLRSANRISKWNLK